MMTRRDANAGLISSAVLAATPGVAAQEAPIRELPPARIAGGKPLIEALRARRSIREYSDRPLPPQILSDLLWSAFGINRPSGDRTAPYWRHIMVIDVYAAMADGVWLYDPKRHALLPHLRKISGRRPACRTSSRRRHSISSTWLTASACRTCAAEERRLYASVDAGFIGQNVYLFCASEGLATVFRGAVDIEKLNRTMQLGAGQFVTFAQTVGYPRG